MIKNQSIMGIGNFIQSYYNDLNSNIATGWWNERYSRRGERVSLDFKDVKLETVYDVIEFIKSNYKDISQEEVESLINEIGRISVILNYKRVYLWEISTDIEKDTITKPEPKKEKSKKQEPKTQEDVDWENAKARVKELINQAKEAVKDLPTNQKKAGLKPFKDELLELAAKYDITLNRQLGLDKMYQQFAGKVGAKKRYSE